MTLCCCAAAAAAAMATAWLVDRLATRAMEVEVGGCVSAAEIVPQPVKPPATVGHNMQEKRMRTIIRKKN